MESQQFAYNPLQWRNPRNGKWIDMPGNSLDKLARLFDEDQGDPGGRKAPPMAGASDELISAVDKVVEQRGAMDSSKPGSAEYDKAVIDAQHALVGVNRALRDHGKGLTDGQKDELRDALDKVNDDLGTFDSSYVALESSDIGDSDTNFLDEGPGILDPGWGKGVGPSKTELRGIEGDPFAGAPPGWTKQSEGGQVYIYKEDGSSGEHGMISNDEDGYWIPGASEAFQGPYDTLEDAVAVVEAHRTDSDSTPTRYDPAPELGDDANGAEPVSKQPMSSEEIASEDYKSTLEQAKATGVDL